MATIAVRVDDHTREALQDKAREQGMSLSDFIRDMLREAVIELPSERDPRKEIAPESLDDRDRLMFSLLHRILGRVLPGGSNGVDGEVEYQLDRAKVLEQGFTREYSTEYAGLYPELSKRDCIRVMDILDMFRIAAFSLSELAKAGTPLDEEVKSKLHYEGFDFNDHLEGQMADYVEYLVGHGKWSENKNFLEVDGGNSHSPMLESYLRMLAGYRRILDYPLRKARLRHVLSADELGAIARESMHPSHRPTS